jgi:hypothetical protein
MDRQTILRAIELQKYMRAMDIRLKRHYRMSRPQINEFWRRVWTRLRADPGLKTEQATEEELIACRKKNKPI